MNNLFIVKYEGVTRLEDDEIIKRRLKIRKEN